MSFNNSLQICFQFFVKAVAELSDFIAEKKFKAIQKGLWKYHVVLPDFIFGRTPIWIWFLNRLERYNGIQWSWVQIPLRPTFYRYFKVSFSGEYHVYHSFRYTHVITPKKYQLKQTWQLMKAITEKKLDTEETIKLE